MKTWKNKLCGTALILFATFAIPLFFAKENCID